MPASKSLATDQVLYSLMSVNDGSELFDASGKVTFDTPKNEETLGFYKQLADLSPSGIASWTWPEPQDAFNAGAVAMAIEKGQYLAPFEPASGQPADQLGCAQIPVAPGGKPASIYYSNGAMVLTSDPAKRKGAAAFLAFVLEPKNYAEFLLAEPGLFLPLTEDGNTEGPGRRLDPGEIQVLRRPADPDVEGRRAAGLQHRHRAEGDRPDHGAEHHVAGGAEGGGRRRGPEGLGQLG